MPRRGHRLTHGCRNAPSPPFAIIGVRIGSETMKEREYTAEERLGGLFQPDTLLPSQFFDRVRRRVEHDGERRLMIAVLEDAVGVYRKQGGAPEARHQQLFREAEEGIGDWHRTLLVSLQDNCGGLHIGSSYQRRGAPA